MPEKETNSSENLSFFFTEAERVEASQYFSMVDDSMALADLKFIVRLRISSETHKKDTRKKLRKRPELVIDNMELVEYTTSKLNSYQIGAITRILDALIRSKVKFADKKYPKIETVKDVRHKSVKQLSIYHEIGEDGVKFIKYLLGESKE